MTSFEFNKIKESINSNLSYLDRREEIFSNFINNGFPNKRNESWRYFDLASKSKSYVKKNISNSQIIVENLHENNNFYDCLENNLSSEDYFKPCSYFKNESVVDLNIACGNQIKILDIDYTQNDPIVVRINYDDTNISLPRLIINVSDNVKAKINYINKANDGFLNLLVEYNIGHKSELDVSRINSSQGLLVETNLVFLLNQSTFEMKNLSLPIDSSRLQLFSNHIGERSTCTSKTISIPAENSTDDILVDNIFSESNCESVSGVRAILDKDSVCTFQSMIDIHNSVLGSKAEQDCKGFLLSDRAVMNAKPQMKIFNDDVICKHGATIGSLNEDEIFYLRTRGLDRKKAINLILDGHINSYIGHEAFLKEFLPEEYR